MFIVACSTMLLVGTCLIAYGALELKNRVGGQVQVNPDDGSVSAQGPIAGPVVCIVVGAALLAGAATLARQTGSNPPAQEARDASPPPEPATDGNGGGPATMLMGTGTGDANRLRIRAALGRNILRSGGYRCTSPAASSGHGISAQMTPNPKTSSPTCTSSWTYTGTSGSTTPITSGSSIPIRLPSHVPVKSL